MTIIELTTFLNFPNFFLLVAIVTFTNYRPATSTFRNELRHCTIEPRSCVSYGIRPFTLVDSGMYGPNIRVVICAAHKTFVGFSFSWQSQVLY